MKDARRFYAFIADWPESESYQVRLIEGILGQSEKAGALVITVGAAIALQADTTPQLREYVLNLLRAPEIDGIILDKAALAGIPGGGAFCEAIRKESGKPVALLGEKDEDPSAEIDEGEAFAELLTHLHKVHGYRKFACISGPGHNKDAQGRLKIYCNTLSALGLDVTPRTIAQGTFTMKSAMIATSEFLDARAYQPEVIVCANDQMALGALAELGKRGLRVPKDIAITGFDDASICGVAYPFTTVRKPFDLQAARAFKTLDCDVRGIACDGDLDARGRLVLKSSCGCSGESEWLELARSGFVGTVLKMDETDNIDSSLGTWCRDIVEKKDLSSSEALLEALMGAMRMERLRVVILNEPERMLGSSLSLVAGFEGGKAMRIPKGGLAYPAGSLLPPGLSWAPGDDIVLHLLLAEGMLFGLLYCSGRTAGKNSLEVFRRRLASSLYTIWLVRKLQLANNSMTREIELRREAEEELKKALERVELLSIRDELTGILNRRGFHTIAEQHLNYLARSGSRAFVFFCDIDGLKAINDGYGHEDGDFAIKAAAGILHETLRSSDIVARQGGDEFTVLAACEQEGGALHIKNRIAEACSRFNESSGKPFKIAISVGSVEIPVKGRYPALEELLREADQKLYEDKKEKKRTRKESSKKTP